jgi:glycerate kinase
VRLQRIEGQVDQRVIRVAIDVACDVRNPLVGPEGASAIFGPQKGATPEIVAELDAALTRYADVLQRFLARDVRDVPGAGAAGGLGAGLVAFADAKLRSGAEIVMGATRFDERVRGVDLVITGEGRVDAQSGYGKVTGSVVGRAAALGKPVALIAGGIAGGYERLFATGLSALEIASDGPTSLDDAMARADDLIAFAAERLARSIQLGTSFGSFPQRGKNDQTSRHGR